MPEICRVAKDARGSVRMSSSGLRTSNQRQSKKSRASQQKAFLPWIRVLTPLVLGLSNRNVFFRWKKPFFGLLVINHKKKRILVERRGFRGRKGPETCFDDLIGSDGRHHGMYHSPYKTVQGTIPNTCTGTYMSCGHQFKTPWCGRYREPAPDVTTAVRPLERLQTGVAHFKLKSPMHGVTKRDPTMVR